MVCNMEIQTFMTHGQGDRGKGVGQGRVCVQG